MNNPVRFDAPSRNPLALYNCALVLWAVSRRAADLVAAGRVVTLLIPWPAEVFGAYCADRAPLTAEELDTWVSRHVSTAGWDVTLGPAGAGRHATRGPCIVVPLRPVVYRGYPSTIRREVWARAARYTPVYIDARRAHSCDATTPEALYATRRDARGVTIRAVAETCRELMLRATLLDAAGSIVATVDSDGDVCAPEVE